MARLARAGRAQRLRPFAAEGRPRLLLRRSDAPAPAARLDAAAPLALLLAGGGLLLLLLLLGAPHAALRSVGPLLDLLAVSATPTASLSASLSASASATATASATASATATASPSASPPFDPPPDAPHIALCITGSLRTFLLPPVHESIHSRLVAPHRTGNASSIDVYIFLTTRHSRAGSNFHGVTDAECSAAPLARALALLAPSHVELFGGFSGCESNVSFAPGEACCAEGNVRPLAYMQMGWVRKCFAHARARHAYTHYVRTRPDLYIGAPVPPWVYAPRNAHRLWTMDKDARGSDMFFVVSERVLAQWWLRFSWENCGRLPDTYAEYLIFEGLALRAGYDRGRCREASCIPQLPPPAADEEPPPNPADDAAGAPVALYQLPGMRNVIVRSVDRVSCWKTGFYCRPDDELALLALLAAYNCSIVVEALEAALPEASPAVSQGGGVTLRALRASAGAGQPAPLLQVRTAAGGWAGVGGGSSPAADGEQ